MSDTTVETVENVEESSTTSNVANFVVLGFAIIGAVQTTKFAITKVREGIRYVQTVKKAEAETETVAHATEL